MLFKPQIGLVTFAVLLILLIPAAHAVPSFSLQDHASYTLSGSLTITQNCNAVPDQYQLQACYGFVPPPTAVLNSSVLIRDDRACAPTSNNCNFTPSTAFTVTGGSVDWHNNGSVVHTVTSCDSTNSPPASACPIMNTAGLDSFNSGTLAAGMSYSHIFIKAGAYNYYCAIHPWMRGTVIVTSPSPPPTPTPQQNKVTINFDGTVGWAVQGLDSSNALLQIDHAITISVSPLPGVTVTPVTEHGSFSQNIDLATRVDSPGTASALLRGLFSSYLSGLPYYYSPRTTATLLPGESVNDPFKGLQNSSVVVQPVSGFLPQQLLSQLPGSATDSKVSYTMWWVNGPLANGKTVKILTGTSAVTGDETLNIGDGVGNRNGWQVTSKLSQSLDTSVPLSGSSTMSFSLNLAWSFDKKNDLLLRHATIASVDSKSVNTQSILVSNPCAPQGYCPTFAQATVTRQSHVDLNLALKLSSTNVNLNGKTGSGGSDTSGNTMTSALLQLPWTIMGPAIVTAAGGLTALSVLIIRRAHDQHPQLAPENHQNT